MAELIPQEEMGGTVRWAQNCLKILKLMMSVNGKESIPAQFFEAIFIPEEIWT